jgi:hypothetical protein
MLETTKLSVVTVAPLLNSSVSIEIARIVVQGAQVPDGQLQISQGYICQSKGKRRLKPTLRAG